ncbi:MAG: stage II sporulation protein R [Clostridiales bacterium]|nr:stage II sporulation protein R [Clostridiales bacterium]
MKRYEWIFSAAAIIVALIISSFTGVIQNDNTDNLIRLHVIANSDSPEDQELKLHVRDRLLLAFGEKFRDVQTLEEARKAIEASLPELEKTALAEIRERGYSYNVKAQLGIFPFPTRVYGDVVYPAGNYEALRLVIGEGRGANWWCVMFPPLCFVDVSSGIAEQNCKDDKHGLAGHDKASEEDFGRNLNETEQNVVYKLKAVELWKDFLEWVDRLF